MRMRKLFLSLVSVSLLLSLAFSGMCLDAAAASVSVLPATLASWLGEEIHAQYLSNTYTYKATTLHIVEGDIVNNNVLQNPSNNTWSSIDGEWTSSTSLRGRYVVWYYFDIPEDLALTNSDFTTPQLICDWNVYFSDVVSASWWTCCSTSAAMINAQKYTIQKPYNYTEFGENPNSSAFYCYMPSQPSPYQNKPAWFSCSPFSNVIVSGGDISPETNFAYCGVASYSGLHADNSRFYVGVVCPVFNDDVYYMGHIRDYDVPTFSGSGASSGTVSGTISDDGNGGQNIHVTVETDNSGLIGSILSGIKNLFVPEEGFMDEWAADLKDDFSEHLGGVGEIWDYLDEQADYLSAATSARTIYLPLLHLDFPDGDTTVPFEFGGQQIELRPYNETGKLDILWNALAYTIDVVCVLAVLNMLQTKFEIFLNPDGEVITYDS